jgi:hypothetical protein
MSASNLWRYTKQKLLRGFPKSLPKNPNILHYIIPYPFPSLSLQILYYQPITRHYALSSYWRHGLNTWMWFCVLTYGWETWSLALTEAHDLKRVPRRECWGEHFDFRGKAAARRWKSCMCTSWGAKLNSVKWEGHVACMGQKGGLCRRFVVSTYSKETIRNIRAQMGG